MLIYYKNKEMVIDDNAPDAKKIQQGHDFHITDKDKLVIDGMGKGMKNRWQIQKAIQNANSIADIKKILSAIVDLMDNYGS